MRSLKSLITLALLVVGALIYLNPPHWGPLEPLREQLAERNLLPAAQPHVQPLQGVPAASGEIVRIASFNIQVFGETKLAQPQVVDILARIVRLFDVVAIQEIRSEQQDLLPRFTRVVNADGQYAYDYVIGPRLGRTSSKEQYAYLFNTATLEIDRSSVYTVEDRDDLLHREPLVAAFRSRLAPPQEAFTFTLVNIHVDPDEVPRELNVLDDVFRAVRNDGRQEDDIILLGDFNADPSRFGELGQLPYVQWAIQNQPTNTRGTQTYDNLVFDRRATIEFLGRAGVLDLVREFNLSQEAALQVSDHLPIWGEFSVREGGLPGHFAERAEPAVRR